MLLLTIMAVALCACNGDASSSANIAARYDYPPRLPASCPAGTLASAGNNGEKVAGPPAFRVRTPANYEAGFAHPLLVVYAAAGASAAQTERYTRLTPAATSHGFLVAYVDHSPMRLRNVVAQGNVARSVAQHWCVDPQRVYLAGHSDGGTVSTGLALLPSTRQAVHGIAVSAAGFQKSDLEKLQCRPPIPVMVMHGAKDSLFPGWGREAAQWWARCNGCTAPAAAPDSSGCVSYSNCPGNAPVEYCEGPQGHREWPGLESRIIEFFLGQAASMPHLEGGN